MTGSYASTTDLRRLAANASFLAGIPVSDQESALHVASDRAEGYLTSFWVMPLKSWQDDLRWAVCQLAFYDLLSARGYNPDAGSDPNVRKRYEDAMEWLKSVADGTLSPQFVDSSDGQDSFVVTSESRGWSSRGGAGRVPFQGD